MSRGLAGWLTDLCIGDLQSYLDALFLSSAPRLDLIVFVAAMGTLEWKQNDLLVERDTRQQNLGHSLQLCSRLIASWKANAWRVIRDIPWNKALMVASQFSKYKRSAESRHQLNGWIETYYATVKSADTKLITIFNCTTVSNMMSRVVNDAQCIALDQEVLGGEWLLVTDDTVIQKDLIQNT